MAINYDQTVGNKKRDNCVLKQSFRFLIDYFKLNEGTSLFDDISVK